MGLSIAITFGLVVWIVLWSLGTKSLDAFLITIVVALLATTVRMLAPYVPGNRDS